MKTLIEKLKALHLYFVRRRTFSANTMEELEIIWQNQLMDKGWEVKKTLDVRWNWLKFDYEYYFIAEYVN